MGYYYYMDATYILVIIGAVLCLLASAKVKSAYKKYENIPTRSGYTGAQVAEMILRGAGITDVPVYSIPGELTDNYSPQDHTLNLSQEVYNSTSIAAIGVAAHECGHAIQHNRGYAPLSIRSAIVPVANIGSTISWPLIIIGLLIPNLQVFITIGVFLFSLVVLLQFVTLPVEFNASGRAITILRDGCFLDDDELKGAKKVLTAAALTYVASMLSSLLQLLRLVLLSRRRR
jgi:Zn-dependent membrane protease YugP